MTQIPSCPNTLFTIVLIHSKLTIMAESSERTKAPHVLAIPFPAEDQITPFLNLTHILASHGLYITILTTQIKPPYIDQFIAKSQSAGLEIRSVDVELPSTPEVPTSTITEKSFPNLVYAFRLLADPIEHWIEKQSAENPVNCIISDFYLGWTETLAAKLKIPRFVFHASSAFAVCVDNSLWTELPHLTVKSDDEPFLVPDLPIEISLCRTQISRTARQFQKFDARSEFLRENRLLNLQSSGAVVNTFYDLELLHISKLHEITGKPVWALGPLIMQPRLLNDQTLAVQCWLDGQNPGSVLCVSVGDFESKQIAELGFGLEGLGRPFLWINNSDDEILGEFKERVRDRGVVINGDSAPSGTVFLPHPSIGGFVTRGGWNSILASITAGVPVITWPVEGDHFSNSVLVVDVLKIGVELCRGNQGFPHRNKLKRAVDQIMGEGRQAEKVRELGDLAKKSASEGFSSTKAFVDEIRKFSSPAELSV